MKRRESSGRRACRSTRSAPAGLALLLLAGCGPVPRAPEHLVLVLLDTTRADHLACYGYPKSTMPTVDGLAAGGLRFEAVYAQSSLTPVSAATLLTGSLPFRHGIRSLFVVGKETLAADVPSLPQLLADAGKRTAAFVSAKPMGAHYGLARGFATYHDDLSATADRHGAARFGDSPQRPGDETMDLALAWLEENGRRPFALLVHLFDAHDPSFVPPRDFLAEHVSFSLPGTMGRIGAHYRAFVDPANRRELYDAELAFMDLQLARLLAKLEELNVARDTLVVVVGDHGEAFGEHDYWTHGLLYEEQLRVPLVLHGPGVPVGQVVEGRGRVVDLLPTLIELFELPEPQPRLDGSSLLRLAAEEGSGPRRVYAEVHHAADDVRGRETEIYSLTDGIWKYIHHPRSGEHELFHLGRDPGELDNLYSATHKEALRLRTLLDELGAVDGAQPDLDDLDPGDLDDLRDLGYL